VTYPDKARALHVAASRWYLSEDRPVPAIEHLLQAGLDDEALPLIASHTPALFQAGRVRLLARWLDRIDRKRLLADPRMGLAYTWVLLLNRRYSEAMQTMAALLAADVPADQQAKIAFEVETLRCVLLAMTDQIEACLAAGLAHLERIPGRAIPVRQRGQLAGVFAGGQSSVRGRAPCAVAPDAGCERCADRISAQHRGFSRRRHRSGAGPTQQCTGAVPRRRRARLEPQRGEQSQTRLPSGMGHCLYEANALEDCARVLAEAMPYCKGYAPPDAMIAGFILRRGWRC
jgi:LuxR family maltose regulon positive regulatory protein